MLLKPAEMCPVRVEQTLFYHCMGKVSGFCFITFPFCFISAVFLQRQKWIVNYRNKKFVKESQYFQRIGIFIHILSWRQQKHQCLFLLLRFFDKLFDAINDDPFSYIVKDSTLRLFATL